MLLKRNRQICGSAGIGRQARLRGVWATVWVQVPPTAPKRLLIYVNSLFYIDCRIALWYDFDKDIYKISLIDVIKLVRVI